MSFNPLSGPWGYAYEAIEHIEQHNCSRGHGCVHGARPGSKDWKEIGPGGSCGVLAALSIGADEPIEELDMDGGATHVTCWEYSPRPVPPVAPAVVPVSGQLDLFGADR